MPVICKESLILERNFSWSCRARPTSRRLIFPSLLTILGGSEVVRAPLSIPELRPVGRSLRGIGLVGGSPRWQNLARHLPAGRALVSDKTRLNSERRDPHDLLHRGAAAGAGNSTSSSRKVRHNTPSTLVLSPFASIHHQSNGFPLREELSRIRSAMPIRHYLQGHRFAPETARLLGVAFEMALVTLQHADGPVAPTRDAVAQKIIELAKAGERDPKRLCDGGDHVNHATPARYNTRR